MVGMIGLLIDLIAAPLLLSRTEETALAPRHETREPGASGAEASAPQPSVPWTPIVLIGLAVMVMYIADSATSNWSTKYLQDSLHASKSTAPLGVAAYLTCQLLGRAVAVPAILALAVIGLAPSFRIAKNAPGTTTAAEQPSPA